MSRQLETAIELYFSSGDLVAAWTLGAAAYNVLRDLGRGRGGKLMLLKEQIPALVPADVKKNLVRKIQETENFFKHADRDPDATLDFQPLGQIELLFFDASLKYVEFTGQDTPTMALARMWFLSKAQIEYDGGEAFEEWLGRIKPLPGEGPEEYRRRIWPEAVRLARHTASAPFTPG